MITTTPNRPVLRYHGGKFLLREWVISHFPQHRVYVEPYGGAASVLMGKPRAKAEIYNDLDGVVVNVFRVLRDPAQAAALERLLRLTPFSREEFNYCYEYADDNNCDPVEQARRTIVRSFMGYGAGSATRVDRTGFRSRQTDPHYHLPSHDWATYHDAIRSFTDRLQGVVIESRPAAWVMQHFDGPETLHYVDPPYVREVRGTPRMDYRHEMSDDDHRDLAAVLHGLQGKVVLSGYPSDLYTELYGYGWVQRYRTTHNSRAHKRQECLWLRNVTQESFL